MSDALQPATHADIAALQQKLDQMMQVVQKLNGVPESIARLERLINGVPEEDLPGLRGRVQTLEKEMRDIQRYVTILKIVAPLVAAALGGQAYQLIVRFLGGP